MNLMHIKSMMHSPVYNYIVPGLTSWLIGEPNQFGKVRLFHSERSHLEFITPHSHRYDFTAIVLDGYVENILYTESIQGEAMMCSTLVYEGEIGKFTKEKEEIKRYTYDLKVYGEMESYSMTHDQIHSIYFRKNSYVLMLEGKEQTKESVMLEPVINNKRVPTGETQDWMFKY